MRFAICWVGIVLGICWWHHRLRVVSAYRRWRLGRGVIGEPLPDSREATVALQPRGGWMP